jgi:membrane protein
VLLTRRIERWLWQPRAEALHGVARAGLLLVRHLYAVLRDVTTGPLTLHAMGLVYVTILAVVPLLAVSLSVLKAFGFEREIEPLLRQLLGPLGSAGADLTAQIMGFVANAQGNVLAGVGLLVLFLTAISMAEQVEGSLNQIWRVDRPRSLGRRVTEYLTVILVGPVVMVTAMTLIARLQSAALLQEISGATGLGPGHPAASLAPYLLVCAGFAFVYWLVPNTKVRPLAAIAGGGVGGVLWAGTGAVFAAFVVNAAATVNIYASLAIAITALFWLYLCWLILLVGAQVAFYTQNPDYLRIGYRPAVTGTGPQEHAALAVMLLVGEGFRDGRGATSTSEITQATGLPGLALAPVIAHLEAARLLTRTADERLLPGRDADSILLRDIVHAVRHPEGTDVGAGIRWPPSIAALGERLETGLEGSLGGESLSSLFGPSR